MLKKMKCKVFIIVLALILTCTNFVNYRSHKVMAEVKGPELLITEIMPMAISGEDPFEYIELYNNTDRNIDLKGYKFLYPEIDINVSKVIPPRGIIVICTRGTTSLQSFNAFYGKSITSDKFMNLSSTRNLLDEASKQYVFLSNDDDNLITFASYGTGDFELKRSIGYKYPSNGLEMTKYALKQEPTPGEINPNQVPNINVAVTGITINTQSMNMKVGETATLRATVLPANATNKEVTWSSGNSAVADVYPGGLVYAKSEGAAIIMARTVDGGYTVYCTVFVKAPTTNIPVQDVRLNKNYENLEIGKTLKLTATIIPSNATNKQLIWSSSDTSVAVVDMNGVVYPIKVGIAVISVSTPDNLHKAYCAVNVIQVQNIAVTGVKLNKQLITINKGKYEKLTASVIPENATNKKLIWWSENSGVATVDQNGKVTGTSQGVTTIYVKTEDGGFIAACIVIVNNTTNNKGAVTGVRLNHYMLLMRKKTSENLTAIVEPSNASNKKVTWQSSNKKVAEVSKDGKVTAKSQGMAVITAKTVDGGYEARCFVIVSNSMFNGKGNKHFKYFDYLDCIKDFHDKK